MEHYIEKAKSWSLPPYDEATRKEVQALLDSNNMKELEERFLLDLEFGTGGMRGILGAGSNRMNLYTIGKAAQGLAEYINSTRSGGSIVIARDSRRMSLEFSRRAAEICAGNNIHVYYFDDICPTPVACFAMRHFKTLSGIIITASHNPPEYNGFKVYWDDGGQIVPPVDNEIIQSITEIQSIDAIVSMDFKEAEKQGKITIVGDDLLEKYYSYIGSQLSSHIKSSQSLTLCYTPLHGTGYRALPELLKRNGFTDVHLVPSQEKPDGEFPTVSYPNPEEPRALELALQKAGEVEGDLVLATDPDADRLGGACRRKDGTYMVLNGNRIGQLLLYSHLKKKKEEDSISGDDYVISTVVTSPMIGALADHYGVQFHVVLTGFKWIAHKMKELENSPGNFIFGSEESHGYLAVDDIRDKDGVSSALLLAQTFAAMKDEGKDVEFCLKEMFRITGFYWEELHTATLPGLDGKKKIQEIMENFRKNAPAHLGGRDILSITDLLDGTLILPPGGKKKSALSLPSSNVLQFQLEGDMVVSMRPSGTEPKIKFYYSVHFPWDDTLSLDDHDHKGQQEIKGVIEAIEKEITQ